MPAHRIDFPEKTGLRHKVNGLLILEVLLRGSAGHGKESLGVALTVVRKLQDDDRDAVPVSAIEAGGRAALQRNRPDGTRMELEMILNIIAYENCACA